MSSQRGMFLCSDCKRSLPFYAFGRNTSKGAKRLVNGRCKECSSMHRRIKRKVRHREYKDKHGLTFMKARLLKFDGILTYQLRGCLNAARQRAKEKEIPFNLDLDHLLNLYKGQDGKCPLLGVELGLHYNDRYKVSIDRIISDKGYTKNNVVLLSKLANTMKSGSTLNELKTFCENGLNFVENTGKNKTEKAKKFRTKIITELGLAELLEG